MVEAMTLVERLDAIIATCDASVLEDFEDALVMRDAKARITALEAEIARKDALISEVREHLADGYVGKAIYAIDRGPLATLKENTDDAC